MDLLQKIYEAGVVGAGGAGFPTHIKLNCEVEYFIINAVECEPLMHTDKHIIMNKGKEIILAVEEIGKLVGANQCIIAIKEKNTKEIKHLKEIIEALSSKITLFTMGDYYPAGDEQMMVYEITGKPIPEAGIPLDVGAVVSNVGSIVNIYDAMMDKPVVDRFLTVTGDVKNPTMINVPVGISVKACIEAAGGSALAEYAIIIGGPMMGTIIDDHEAENHFIKKMDGSLIVLPKDHFVVERKRKPIDKIINETKTACIQCRYCTDMCHRYLLGHQLRPHKIMRNIGMSDHDEAIMKEALLCCECGICEIYACPMGLSPRLVNVHVKKELYKKGVRPEKGSLDLEVRDMMAYRKIPSYRLISRLDLLEYYGQPIDECKNLTPETVTIHLKQHIGKPATEMVSVGDVVTKGQMIGKVGRDELGANVHASIEGTVIEVTEKITIKSNGVVS
ncbi:MAG: proton-conducting membrane transporter [Firmicutes bacterium HGW-Firmicutes-2]|nr:MAG: proton-conducting membrane transporter [Firmicutes bacterium HGW-Firmicutes-2]